MDKTFAQDVISGLTSKEKKLSSKYFYDDEGSRIFREIMGMPEYYPTNCELEILTEQASNIVSATQFSKHFKIIEFGAGDGFKTFQLLEYLVSENISFDYIPIDISQEAITTLSEKLKKQLPELSIKPQVGDYFEILEKVSNHNVPSLLLFLGGNIGNYQPDEVTSLLELFNKNMNKGDKLLIGIDLKKNPNTIRTAYNDDGGITKRFNLNLLRRINSEFDGNFNIDDFDFFCSYNPFSGEVKSYLVSLKEQLVSIKKLNLEVSFQKNEMIWTELSKKYDLSEIQKVAAQSDFKVTQNFFDSREYFTDSLWEK
ncbi:L-histidine N(alpha)-methyltransferase [Ulvibacter antarcticus]|uniref:Dimethylhistidine N-methyltransferase n=1 Tax=Ulvibacter antarcticus TaxID=442714 RepID=A0A3L9YUQ7_9FLAO|nr:L-histidine N(alpha)-methyltransferase [Ulvibacter antarcticus]RMA64396.1 dimethylhistidine N-methyltransferase [Ulvibacter antarcticus]